MNAELIDVGGFGCRGRGMLRKARGSFCRSRFFRRGTERFLKRKAFLRLAGPAARREWPQIGGRFDLPQLVSKFLHPVPKVFQLAAERSISAWCVAVNAAKRLSNS